LQAQLGAVEVKKECGLFRGARLRRGEKKKKKRDDTEVFFPDINI